VQETERQLVEAIHAGEREALRRLYERYSRYAMGVSLRIVPEREDALDIVQDAFVSILTTIGSFEYRGEGSLRNWVARITTHRALDWMRSHDRLLFADQLPDETAEEEDETPLEEVPPDILGGMIDRLPETSKTIVTLHSFGQMSHKEIAQKLGISAKTSMSQFSRARRLLEMMMKEYLNSQGI
jgi:RNA polymerase sigma-70 factor (ECF subfamily)